LKKKKTKKEKYTRTKKKSCCLYDENCVDLLSSNQQLHKYLFIDWKIIFIKCKRTMLRDIHPFKSLTSRIAANAKQTVSKEEEEKIWLVFSSFCFLNFFSQQKIVKHKRFLVFFFFVYSRISIGKFKIVVMNKVNDLI